MQSKEIINLSEEQIKHFRMDKINKELTVIGLKSQIEKISFRLDNDFFEKSYRKEIGELEKAIKNKKDSDGNELDDFFITDMEKQLEIKKREEEEGIISLQKTLARKGLEDLKKRLDLEENNIKVLEKNIREKKMTLIQ